MSAADRQRSLAGAPAGGERRAGFRGDGERRPGFRAVGVAVSKLAQPIGGKRGRGTLVRLKTDWPAIVGAEWAVVAWPVSLGRDSVLKLRTVPVAALELQHRAPLLIERINLYFGRPAVIRLVLVQGPVPHHAPAAAPPRHALAAGEAEALDARLADVADPELRAALGRLGRAIIAARK